MSRHHPYRAPENRRRHSQRSLDSSGEENTGRLSSELHNLDQLREDKSVAICPTVNITRKVVDRQGQTQALLTCSTSGIWSIHSPDNLYAFTVKINDPSFQNVIASKQPWDYEEWSTPTRINILLELLHSESRLSDVDELKFKLFRCTRRIARKFEVLPSSLYLWGLTKEGNNYKWGGGYADIWKGQTASGDPVCLKVLRVFTPEHTKKQLFKEFSEEALVWSQLNHPNVLPFLGTNVDLFPESYCLVSSWCNNGNVMIYLSTHPDTDKIEIIWDILKGLEYLHTRKPPVVHGDLKGANILVSDSGQCRLADFGLAGMTSTLTLSSAGNGTRGSVRWMAPELFDYEMNLRPSMVTDMYSFGCTVFEIITGSPPFSDSRNDMAVLMQVVNGSRPLRPANGFSDRLWTAVEKCWVDPNNRHTAKTFIDYVPELLVFMKSPVEQEPTLLTQTFNSPPESPSSQLLVLSDKVIRRGPASDVHSERESYGPLSSAAAHYEGHPARPPHPNPMMLHLVGQSSRNSLSFGPPSPPTQEGFPPQEPYLPTSNTLVPLPQSEFTTNIMDPQHRFPSMRQFRLPQRTQEARSQPIAGKLSPSTVSCARWFPDHIPSLPENTIVVNGILDELDNHYVNTVVGLQYLLGDKRTLTKILSNAVEKDGFARHAARLLALVHIQRSRVPRQPTLETAPICGVYKELLTNFSFAKQQFDDDDALAALNVISAFIFDGGHSDWQRWLQVASIYSSHVLEDRTRFHDYQDAILNCSDKERFIIKTTFRYDVIASITTMNAPKFAHIINDLYNPANQPRLDSKEFVLLSMLPIMGCENRIVWALSETSRLFVWKQACEKGGLLRLGMPELSKRAADIEAFLAPRLFFSSYEDEVMIARSVASEIFRTSAIVYLRIIVHGDHPLEPEISKAVTDAVKFLERVAIESTEVRHVVVQSTIFAFFICAALTNKLNELSFLLKHLEGEGKVGIRRGVSRLLQEMSLRQTKPKVIPWREMLHESKMLLV